MSGKILIKPLLATGENVQCFLYTHAVTAVQAG